MRVFFITLTMKDKIYNIESLTLETTCAGISIDKYDELYTGAKKANGKKIRMLIKKHLPELYNDLCLNLYNPFEKQSVRTKTHFIYLHSATDYFLKIN